jgi:hypothetical protein
MGEVIPFPDGGRKGSPSTAGAMTMFCVSCGAARTTRPADPDAGPCSCGGLVFTNVRGAAISVSSPIPVDVVVGPITWGGNYDDITAPS